MPLQLSLYEQKYGVPPGLLSAVMQQESGGNPKAVSPAGAQGLFQFMPDTAKQLGVDPWDENSAADGAARYLAQNYQKFGDWKLALAAYNAGPGNVEKHKGIPPFAETQNYVRNIVNNYNKGTENMATPTNDWRSRAQPYTQPAPQEQPAAPTAQPIKNDLFAVNILPQEYQQQASAAQAASDWKKRAQPVQQGTDMGRTSATVQGFNSAIPFGERIAAGLGAGMAYGYDQVAGEGDTSLGDFYRAGRENQAVTSDAHPGYYAGGTLAGVAATLPAASAKAITGEAATTGIRGAVNAIPEALQSVGNYVRGSGAATGAANVAGKALRSAAVAAPAGAVYSYGASEHGLDTPEALQDATSGARMGAAIGAALPVAGATISSVISPKVTGEVKELARKAIDKFGIKLSMDQVAPTRVRNAVQKVSQNLPGSGVDAFQAAQRQQWTRAVAKEIGQDSADLGPETINKFLDDASVKFDNVLKGKTIKVDYDPLKRINAITEEAAANITGDYAKIVQGKADNILNQLFTSRQVPSGIAYKAKALTGDKLASMRSQLVKSLPNISGDAKTYVSEMVDVIDEIAQKNLPKDAIAKLADARREWRNFKTIEPLLEKSTDGTIDPAQLMQRVASSKYIKASRKAVGEDNLVDLARIGKQFLRQKGGSDTAPNLLIGTGALGNASLLVAAPQAAIPAMLAQGGVVGANKLYQAGINQSQRLVKGVVNSKATNAAALPIADMLAVGAAEKLTGK